MTIIERLEEKVTRQENKVARETEKQLLTKSNWRQRCLRRSKGVKALVT